LLQNLTEGRASRFSITAVVADGSCRAGALFGLDSSTLDDAREALQSDAASFFAGASRGWTVGELRREEGSWIGTVIDRDAESALHAAAESIGADLDMIVTAPAATADLSVRVATAPPGERRLMDRVDYAGPRRRARAWRRRRDALLITAALLGVWAFVAPGALAYQRLRQSESVSDSLAAHTISSALGRPSIAISQVAAAGPLLHQRGQLRSALDRLVASLPDSTAVVSIVLDSSGGRAALLGRNIGPAIERLADGRSTPSASLDGPITYDLRGELMLQRASLAWGAAELWRPVRRIASEGGRP
jgi:hypothetical protein